MRLLFRLLLILVTGVFLFDTGFAQRKSRVSQPKAKPVLSAQKIAERFLPSVVLIVCDDGKHNYSQGSGFFLEVKPLRPPPEPLVFVGPDGSTSTWGPIALPKSEQVVLTNYHVIEGMVRGKAKVVVGGRSAGEWWIDEVLYTDEKNDLAVLSLRPNYVVFDGKTTNVDLTESGLGVEPKKPPSLILNSSDELAIGAAVYVLSNPEGLTGTISTGIISGGIRKIKDVDLLQIDASISSGSSGGAVLNAHGEIIGIATGTFSSGQNLNFAVPASSVRRFLQEYEASVKNLKVIQSAVPNGWGILVPRAPESKLPPIVSDSVKSTIGTEQNDAEIDLTPYTIPSMTYDQVASELIASIKNSSYRSEKISVAVSSIGLTGCSLSLSHVSVVGELRVKKSYIADIRSVDDFSTAPGGIRLSLVRGVLERTEIENSFEATMSDTILIPMDPEPSLRSRTITRLKRLKETCTGERAESGPSLSETAEWLTDRIQGTSSFTSNQTTQYKTLQFSGCSMLLVELVSGEVRLQYLYQPSLRNLRTVEVTKNTAGNWGVWLEFVRNFDVTIESLGPYGNRETVKDDKLTFFFDTYEKARRAGTAFARVLELCGEESKEPF